MKSFGRSLSVRLALASALAVGGVLALQHYVQAHEQAKAQKQVLRPPAVPSPLAGLGFRLAPVTGSVLLASRLEAIAPAVAPVLQLLPDGTLAVRRAVPVAGVPGDTTRPRDAAILLPKGPLAAWPPNVRGCLAELIGALLASRPVRPEQLVVVDGVVMASELPGLLGWIP